MNYVNDNMHIDGYAQAGGFKTLNPTGSKVLDDNGGVLNINRLENYFGTCNTEASTANKGVVLDDDTGFALEDGVHLSVVLRNGNTSSGAVTISTDNGVTYKPLYYYDGTAVSGSMAAGTYSLVFYNNTWVMLNGNASSGGSSLADVVYNTNTKALRKTVGGSTTDIVTTADLLYMYGEVREHTPIYVDHTLDLSGNLINLFINTTYLSLFSTREYINDTIIIKPFTEDYPVLDFSVLTSLLSERSWTPSRKRIHIYLMYVYDTKTSLEIKGAVVNNPMTIGGSPSDPGVVLDKTCKLECYYNKDYGYWFVDIATMAFVKGANMGSEEYMDIIDVKESV